MSAARHVAGEPEGEVQRCLRCGKVLTNYRGAMVEGTDRRRLWWPEGEDIVVDGGATWVAQDRQVPPCTSFLEAMSPRRQEARRG